MTDATGFPRLHLGTAPDSWGVWFPADPRQVPWSRYLDEAQRAGYRFTELGPRGYLPTDPVRLKEELDRRGLTLTGGTVTAALHLGKPALDAAKRECALEAATLTPLDATFVVLLPEGFTDLEGNRTASPTLTDDEWGDLTSGISTLARYAREEHGLDLVFHPHADTHVATQDEIVRFLEQTDPRYVDLCLDTGHVAYCEGDNLEIIERFGERIRYVHLKQVDPAIRKRVRDEGLGFAPAVRLGAMVEPPRGEPKMPPVIAALDALQRDLYCIVEQDLYPCDPATPLPIATRTRGYFAGCGLGAGTSMVGRG